LLFQSPEKHKVGCACWLCIIKTQTGLNSIQFITTKKRTFENEAETDSKNTVGITMMDNNSLLFALFVLVAYGNGTVVDNFGSSTNLGVPTDTTTIQGPNVGNSWTVCASGTGFGADDRAILMPRSAGSATSCSSLVSSGSGPYRGLFMDCVPRYPPPPPPPPPVSSIRGPYRHPVTHSATSGTSHITAHALQASYCAAQDQRLCTYQELCPANCNDDTFQDAGHSWVPYSGFNGNYDNDADSWVFLGTDGVGVRGRREHTDCEYATTQSCCGNPSCNTEGGSCSAGPNSPLCTTDVSVMPCTCRLLQGGHPSCRDHNFLRAGNTQVCAIPIPNWVTGDVYGDGLYCCPAASFFVTQCATEGGNCACVGTVQYGANGLFAYKPSTGSIACTNAEFGDPNLGTGKSCYCLPTAPPITPPPAPPVVVDITPCTADDELKCTGIDSLGGEDLDNDFYEHGRICLCDGSTNDCDVKSEFTINGPFTVNRWEPLCKPHIKMPSTVTLIPDAAFENCTTATQVTFPSGLDKIGEASFRNTGLTGVSIPTSVGNDIEPSAFENNAALLTATLPASMTTVPKKMFLICPKLQTVYNMDASIVYIMDFAFANCRALETHPSQTVEYIGNWAYVNCSGLTGTLTMNAVTLMGMAAFSTATGITAASINSLTQIPISAFKSTSSMTSISVSTGLLEIGSGAFSRSGLTSFNFPDSVGYVSQNSFGNCTSLNYIVIEGNSGIPGMSQNVFAALTCDGIRLGVTPQIYAAVCCNTCAASLPQMTPLPLPTTSPSFPPPTRSPIKGPTKAPERGPTVSPIPGQTKSPSPPPTKPPTTSPAKRPTRSPSPAPAISPTVSTASPRFSPTFSPVTSNPTRLTVIAPTKGPMWSQPTASPSKDGVIRVNGVDVTTHSPMTSYPTFVAYDSPTQNTRRQRNREREIANLRRSLRLAQQEEINLLGTPTFSPTMSPSVGQTSSPTTSPTASPTSSQTAALPTLSQTATVDEGLSAGEKAKVPTVKKNHHQIQIQIQSQSQNKNKNKNKNKNHDEGANAGGPCDDNSTFADGFGFGCSNWESHDCFNANNLGYSHLQQVQILANCPSACKVYGCTSVDASQLDAMASSSDSSGKKNLSVTLAVLGAVAGFVITGILLTVLNKVYKRKIVKDCVPQHTLLNE